MGLVLIKAGTVYDPRNGVEGVVRDLWIDAGRVVDPPADPTCRPERTIDASGMVVMPGGVDMHCHIVGPKVNAARKMIPEDARNGAPIRRSKITRSGTTGSVPSTYPTGYLYAGLGYTAAFDAAIPPLGARHAHEEFQETPLIDKGFFVLVGNNQFLMRQLQRNEPALFQAYLGWLLNATKGYAAKVVNPGGVEIWKSTGKNAHGLDDIVPRFGVTPRQILRAVAAAVDELGFPHPMHLHCNNLGVPGNAATTLASMQALEGHRGHVTHIQFHSYGGEADDQSTMSSQVAMLAEYVNSHPNISVDVGQVMFGNTTSMTGDGPLGYFLHRVTGRKWYGGDTEMEAGCGIVPITYKRKSVVNALQWAVGLEWYLLMNDPWRIAMSTDHPNGASFLAYPQIIAQLMDRTRRLEILDRVPPGVRERCRLAELDREYTLNEIAIITRAAPAKLLGLTHKGHLGPGADGDVTIYQPDADVQRMFELPRYVIKSGRVIVEDGEIRSSDEGELLHIAPDFDPAAVPKIQSWFEQNYSLQFRNYPIETELLHAHRIVPTPRAGQSEPET